MTQVTVGAPPAAASPADAVNFDNPASAIAFAATAVGGQLLGGGYVVTGWSMLETSGAGAATVELYDGWDATGQLVAVVAFGAGQSVRDWMGQPGVEVREGLFLRVVSGTVRGVVYAVTRRNP